MAQRLVYLARRRYRFRDDVAEKLVTETLESFSEKYERYADREDKSEIVIGMLRTTCREHIRREIRLTAQRNAVRDVMPRAEISTALAAGFLDDLSSRDARQIIVQALSEVGPKAREAFQFLRDGATRLDVMELLENTMDKRLLHARMEFCRILTRCGMDLKAR